jgi:hypothetical protein
MIVPDADPSPSVGRCVAPVVERFIRAVERGDPHAAAACCDPLSEFSVECGHGVPVATFGPHTFAALYAPRPGAAYRIARLCVHPAPDGAVAVWRCTAYGGGGERALLGVSVFRLDDGRITRVDTTYVPIDAGRDARV